MSLGIAQFPQDGETIRDLLVAADAALYEAKRMGKDRITLADERLSARRPQATRWPRAAAARSSRCAPAGPRRHAQRVAHHGGRRLGVLDELSLALPHDASALYVIDDAAPILRAQRGPVSTRYARRSFEARSA